MFEEYIKKDNRIIRPVDGYELGITSLYLSITDVFPKFSVEEFKKNAQENLSKIDIFNYAIKIMDGHYFWIRKPFKIHIEEVEWSENEEIENQLKNEDKIIIPKPQVRDEEEEDVFVVFLFRVCQLKNDKTKLTFSAMHITCDGRTIFTMFDLIRKVINGEKLEKIESPICSFNQKNNFRGVNPSFYNQTPKIWTEISKLSVLPPIDKPIGHVTIHNVYDYQPISKFCKENGVSVQAMLIAMISRATRKFHNLPKETPLWNHTACDTRASPFATEEYKNRKFFCNAGALYVRVVGQDTLLDDIKHCNERLKESLSTYGYMSQFLISGSAMNPDTLQYTPIKDMPNPHTQAITGTSNIGRVNGNIPLFNLAVDCISEKYVFITHSYHTDEKLFMASIMPVNINKEFFLAIKEQMDLIFKL